MSNKTVTYRILLKKDQIYYKLARTIIHRTEGDISHYYPYTFIVVGDSGLSLEGKKVDPISWHKSGVVHVKTIDSERFTLEERNPIQEIGYQELLKDTIIDFHTLDRLNGSPHKLDVILDATKTSGAIQFMLSVVSGTHMVRAATGGETPVKLNKKSTHIASELRGLGFESGNADKILQYSLYPFSGEEPLSGRRLFFPKDSKIRKL